ncbi:MAG: hypothetical protein ACOX5J_00315 [Candidatus Hydrogenedentales bacterium]|jgi:hypothetical protein
MESQMNAQVGPSRLLSVSQFCNKHEWATIGGLRHLLFNREANGFDKCVVRLGRKILLDEAAVFAWLERHGREGGVA